MIYTIDRVQFDSFGKLLFYEFYNRDKDNYEFINQKFHRLLKVSDIQIIGINYGDRYTESNDIAVIIRETKSEYKWKEYQNWFSSKNNLGRSTIEKNSKQLGTATNNEGDPFVQHILKQIHNLDFSNDDNGGGITKSALQNEFTYGFDFDLFEDESHTIIEFLKNETKQKGKNLVDNLKAHPMRYCWISEKEQINYKKKMLERNRNCKILSKRDNKQKYISLWRAKEILDGELYLVNYSDAYEKEFISIIHVIELDVSKGIMSDISYSVTFEELVIWLDKMNKAPLEAKGDLCSFKKEVRDNEFWKEYYQNQLKYDIPKRSHIGTNYKTI